MNFELTRLFAVGDPGGALAAVLTVALMIPILKIITTHRRNMAEIQFGRSTNNPDEVAALRREVAELKEMVHTQMLALDTYAKGPVAKSADSDIQSRISASR